MTWNFGLGGNAVTGTYWTVNGKPFDPHRVEIEVPRGKRETWLLKNTSPVTHFIHLHEEQWHTIAINGKRPPPWERGLEDTWRLDPGETIEVAAKFTDYTGIFMLHCHMLVHEDDGMMTQFAVVKPGTHTLPHGYYYKTSQKAAAAERSTPMAMAMPAVGASALSAPHGWSRLVVRSSRAVALELFLVVVLLGWRRFRKNGWAGI
jgi:hypothetical protein